MLNEATGLASSLKCMDAELVPMLSVASVNEALFCGYYSVRRACGLACMSPMWLQQLAGGCTLRKV